MKRSIIFVLFAYIISGLVPAKAQDYQYVPIPIENAVWNVYFHSPASNQQYNDQYYTDGDTVISNEACIKIYRNRDDNIEYQGSYFEREKIVYFCSQDNRFDTIYDFNLHVGDTVHFLKAKNISAETTSGDTLLIVKQIDTVFIGGEYRKSFVFKRLSNSAFELIDEKWIEGIGSIHGILFPLNLRALSVESNETEDLTCFYEENNLVWQNNLYTLCTVKLSGQEKPIEYKIFPIPASDHITIQIFEEMSFPYLRIEIYDLLGENVYQQFFDTQSKEIKLGITSLKKGVYFLVITGKDRKKTVEKIVKE